MSDTRTHRGPHPKDATAFSPASLPALRNACEDLCWLLSRGYSPKAALKLVGDRRGLTARQRTALQRTAAGEAEVARRRSKEVPCAELAGATLAIDGYNVLLTVEVALGGGVVLAAQDGTFRDMASMSGHYRRVHQTGPALAAVGEVLEEVGCARARWLLDRPISNSGRLKKIMEAVATEHGWDWEVELAASPDRELAATDCPVATADSAVLDRCRRWVNLARYTVESRVPGAWIVDLSIDLSGQATPRKLSTASAARRPESMAP